MRDEVKLRVCPSRRGFFKDGRARTVPLEWRASSGDDRVDRSRSAVGAAAAQYLFGLQDDLSGCGAVAEEDALLGHRAHAGCSLADWLEPDLDLPFGTDGFDEPSVSFFSFSHRLDFDAHPPEGG